MQSERGLNPADPPSGPTSVGLRPVFNDEAWDMQIEFFVDYRQGSRTGLILPPFLLPPGLQDQFTMFSMSNLVLPGPPPGAVVIPGVTSDFWVSDFALVRLDQGNVDFDTIMVYAHATVPEPAARCYFALAIALFSWIRVQR